jgi:ribosomal protein S28E/S33
MIVKLAMTKIGKRYVRILSDKEKEGKLVDADGYVWEIKTGLDGSVVIVRNSVLKKNSSIFEIENDDSRNFIVREIKGFVDMDDLVSVEVKTEVEIEGESCDVEFVIEKDDVTGGYNVVVRSDKDEIDGIGFTLPKEVGLVFDAIEEPEELMNILEQVVSSEGFKNYILAELGLTE